MSVPVTVKLSEQFYRKFGHELVDEMVNWFNQLDTTYRSELRELNELNFSRFDAKLEQRLAQSDAKWEQRLAQLDAKWEQRLAQLDAKWEQRLAALRDELHAQGKMLLRWMVGLWITAIGTLGGLIVALLRFLPAARP
jgi:hypothetical protein